MINARSAVDSTFLVNDLIQYFVQKVLDIGQISCVESSDQKYGFVRPVIQISQHYFQII